VIYRCVPREVKRPWGSLPGGVGEVWWVYDDPEGSTLLNPLSGGSPLELASIWSDTRFPLVVKTLHTGSDLSIQVHPGYDGGYPRKDETWAVLEGHGTILAGIVSGVDRDSFATALDAGNAAELLERLEAFPGMTLHLPAGTVHSLGAGLSVLEVQLNCDVTYRLWDWNRTDTLGRHRMLHKDQALDSIDWARNGRPEFSQGPVIHGGDYTLERVQGPANLGPWEILFTGDEGACHVSDGAGGRFHAPPGSWKVVFTG